MSEKKATVASYSHTKDIISKYGIVVKKRFGQNFLIDQSMVGKIVRGAGITGDDFVIEVGPGIGALTCELCEKARRVAAIEIDAAVVPVLNEVLSGYDNVSVINKDFLKTPIQEIVAKHGFESAILCANLPYYITTPILFTALESGIISRMAVMVQKEVGERINAKAGTKSYGALTIAVSYYADVSLIAHVPKNCFYPMPNVDSIVIRLDMRGEPRLNVHSKENFFKLVKTAFSTRRKTLLNCVAKDESFSRFFDNKGDIKTWLNGNGISENIRGEDLTPEQFAMLSNSLISFKRH